MSRAPGAAVRALALGAVIPAALLYPENPLTNGGLAGLAGGAVLAAVLGVPVAAEEWRSRGLSAEAGPAPGWRIVAPGVAEAWTLLAIGAALGPAVHETGWPGAIVATSLWLAIGRWVKDRRGVSVALAAGALGLAFAVGASVRPVAPWTLLEPRLDGWRSWALSAAILGPLLALAPDRRRSRHALVRRTGLRGDPVVLDGAPARGPRARGAGDVQAAAGGSARGRHGGGDPRRMAGAAGSTARCGRRRGDRRGGALGRRRTRGDAPASGGIVIWLVASAFAGVDFEVPPREGVETVVVVTAPGIGEEAPQPVAGATVRVTHRPGLAGEKELAIGITDGRGRVRWVPGEGGVADVRANDEVERVRIDSGGVPPVEAGLGGTLLVAGLLALRHGLRSKRKKPA
jgi:hypothetical protein